MSIQIVEKRYKLYLSRSTPGVVTIDGVQRLRNKEINAADNTIIGLEPEIPKSLGAAVWTAEGWAFDNTAYIPASAIGAAVQAYSDALSAIAALPSTAGLLRKTGAGTFALDTTDYSTLAVGSTAGAALAASAAPGTSATAARSDHVHPLPTPANVGAEPAITKSLGFMKWTGSAWAFDNSTYVATNGALGTPSGGNLSNCTADGTSPVGFRNIPQNSKSANYTCVLADAGDHILHPSADTTARTFTIPANSSVPYPIGTAITFVNQNGAGVVTIAIATDTMRLAGAGTTGSRTLAANGVATALKIAATEWIISGGGLT